MSFIKSFKSVFIIAFSLMMNFSVSAAMNSNVSDSTKDIMRINAIQMRVTEIQGMDFNELSRGEKHQLKQELKSLKTESETMAQKDGTRGIYLSVGAVIIIILLLILLL